MALPSSFFCESGLEAAFGIVVRSHGVIARYRRERLFLPDQ
jgi:hypothetical protein